MNPCCDFFTKHEENRAKVKELINEPDRIAWEGLSASVHSPGPVEDSEAICRQLLNPIHVDNDGIFTPTAFDDFMNKGLSTNRLQHKSLEAAQEDGRKRAEDFNKAFSDKPQRQLFGMAEFLTSHLRQVLDMNGARALGVYDTAKSDDTSHADVCMLVKLDEQSKRSVRYKLFEIAKRVF